MKTITIVAVLMVLMAPAWADDAEKPVNDPANSNEPIVLSEAEMDGVTAGRGSVYVTTGNNYTVPSGTTSSSTIVDGYDYFVWKR